MHPHCLVSMTWTLKWLPSPTPNSEITWPAYLNALTSQGVHIVTVNDYLARRDCECEWVGQVPRFLGLSVGLIQPTLFPFFSLLPYHPSFDISNFFLLVIFMIYLSLITLFHICPIVI
ncbi:hypothetical protein RND81_10G084800 [Saponaria officinalis]|uniref:chloroplast protein-transporting ATPase n=1 Tax=Saponaria officinalis TaxID=3572 RepID=A0AAW1HZS5_SAPOF